MRKIISKVAIVGIWVLMAVAGTKIYLRTSVPAKQILISEDGQKVAYMHYRTSHKKVIIMAPGFFNNKETYLFKKMTEDMTKEYDVICFDFRGHGKSNGLFTWTSNEANDLRVVVKYAKEQGYEKIGVMGFSLGAATTLIEASKNTDIDSIVAVSTPYDFWKINYHFWKPEMVEDFKLNIGPKGKGKGIRPGNPFLKKNKPIDIVEKVKAPIYFIHGENDWLINKEHSEKLYMKAVSEKKLTIVKDTGHAEKIYDKKPKEMISMSVEWFDKTM